jgi:L-2-hydroxyglutarate oxidase
VVNCAGLHADRIARICGVRPTVRVLPFRGEYRKLRADRASLVRHLVYPVARPGFPFLGVHFTRRVDGTVDAGPTAVLAFAREGYRVTDFNAGDLAEALVSAGLWRFVARHPGVVAEELARSVTGRGFFEALQGMIPALRRGDLVPGGSGVRAQAVRSDGTLVDDFLWVEGPGAVHVLNAPSPAATASLAIGRVVAARAARALRQVRARG